MSGIVQGSAEESNLAAAAAAAKPAAKPGGAAPAQAQSTGAGVPPGGEPRDVPRDPLGTGAIQPGWVSARTIAPRTACQRSMRVGVPLDNLTFPGGLSHPGRRTKAT